MLHKLSYRFRAETPLFHGLGLFLSDLRECHDKSYIVRNYIVWATFCCGSHFNHFHVIGPKATKIDKIRQNDGHYAVQGHRLFSYQWKASGVTVNNSNLQSLSHRCPDMAYYSSNFRCRQGAPLRGALVRA